MKVISFPHYTCGGLLCDILNDSFSPVGDNGGINSIAHSVGKIGDSPTVLTVFDHKTFLNQVKQTTTDSWIGTHCWLGDPDLDIDDVEVINVTTATYKSKLYRWTRAWYHYYLASDPWQNLQGLTEIDKQRETAKNYLQAFEPIHRKNVVNLEFAEVVECNPIFRLLMGRSVDIHMERWKQINHFLYDRDLNRSLPAQRLYEAEHETLLGHRYVYQ